MGEAVYRWKAFAFYDYRGIETYLETMAQQGLQLEKRQWGLWRFRKAEPEYCRYEVVYTRWENMKPSERTIRRSA